MSDPTIPELIARLREIDCDNWTLCIGEALGALHEDGDRLAEAVCELRKALPVILDALERGQACKCGAPATVTVRYPQVSDTWHPRCDACNDSEQFDHDEVCAHELERFDGAYGIPVREVRPLAVHPRGLRERTTWRPMAEAPRDGTEVALLFAREETVTFGVLSTWPRVRAAFFTGSDWSIPYYANNPPIGWTPLPAPPAAEGGEGG